MNFEYVATTGSNIERPRICVQACDLTNDGKLRIVAVKYLCCGHMSIVWDELLYYNKAVRPFRLYAFQDREAARWNHAVQTSGTAPDNGPRVADVTTAKKNRIAIENFAPDLIPKPGRFN